MIKKILIGGLLLLPILYLLFFNHSNVNVDKKMEVTHSDISSSDKRPLSVPSNKTTSIPSEKKVKDVRTQKRGGQEVKDFELGFNEIFSDGTISTHEYEKAILMVEEFIETNPSSLSEIEDEIDSAFLFSVQIKDHEKALKFSSLLREHFATQYQSKCYQFYLDVLQERSPDHLQETVLSCRGKKDIQEVVSTFIGLLIPNIGERGALKKYIEMQKYIPELDPPSKLFSQKVIEGSLIQ